MKKIIFYYTLFLIFFVISINYALSKDKFSCIVEVDGYSYISENLTISQMRKTAFANAKRQALEMAKTSIESSSTVEDFQLKHDVVLLNSKGVVSVLKQKDYGIVNNNRYHVWIKANVEYSFEDNKQKKFKNIETKAVTNPELSPNTGISSKKNQNVIKKSNLRKTNIRKYKKTNSNSKNVGIWDLPEILPPVSRPAYKTFTETKRAYGHTLNEACAKATSNVAKKIFEVQPTDEQFKQSVYKKYCNLIKKMPNGRFRVEVLIEFYK